MRYRNHLNILQTLQISNRLTVATNSLREKKSFTSSKTISSDEREQRASFIIMNFSLFSFNEKNVIILIFLFVNYFYLIGYSEPISRNL